MKSKLPSNECPWEEIEGFRSLIEFTRFTEWMSAQLESGAAEEVKVRNSYGGPMLQEQWFSHTGSKEKWRLVHPDPGYSPGYFGPVNGK